MAKKIMKICSRGHEFEKTPNCPVCPVCWPGYDRPAMQSDFPEKLGAPALRALKTAKIGKLAALTKYTEKEIGKLHGMGPKGVKMLKEALRKRKLAFK